MLNDLVSSVDNMLKPVLGSGGGRAKLDYDKGCEDASNYSSVELDHDRLRDVELPQSPH